MCVRARADFCQIFVKNEAMKKKTDNEKMSSRATGVNSIDFYVRYNNFIQKKKGAENA